MLKCVKVKPKLLLENDKIQQNKTAIAREKRNRTGNGSSEGSPSLSGIITKEDGGNSLHFVSLPNLQFS